MKNPWFMLIFETVGYIAYVVGFTGLISYFGEVTPRNLTDTVQGRPENAGAGGRRHRDTGTSEQPGTPVERNTGTQKTRVFQGRSVFLCSSVPFYRCSGLFLGVPL